MAGERDRYLNDLDSVAGGDKFGKARERYKFHSDRASSKKIGDLAYYGIDILEGKREASESEIRAVARKLIETSGGDQDVSGYGVSLYEKIGKGKKAIPFLLKSLKKLVDQEAPKSEIEQYRKYVRSVIERNTEERQQGESGLAGRVGVFALFIFGGIALGAGSLTITGNAVSNLTGTIPGLFGIIFFIAGLAGLFFYFKER